MSLSVLLEIVFGVPGLGRMVIAGIEAFSAEWSAAALLMASLLAIAWHFAVNMLIAALDEGLRAEWPVASVRVPT